MSRFTAVEEGLLAPPDRRAELAVWVVRGSLPKVRTWNVGMYAGVLVARSPVSDRLLSFHQYLAGRALSTGGRRQDVRQVQSYMHFCHAHGACAEGEQCMLVSI